MKVGVVISSLSDAIFAELVQAMQKSADEEGVELVVKECPEVNDKITGIENGWAEAFRRVRKAWRSNYDFSEYGREDPPPSGSPPSAGSYMSGETGPAPQYAAALPRDK